MWQTLFFLIVHFVSQHLSIVPPVVTKGGGGPGGGGGGGGTPPAKTASALTVACKTKHNMSTAL
jgi:hypothetical protein